MANDQQDVVLALGGRYDVREELGRGGMATVYLADDVRHHRRVAVKVLRTEVSAGSGADRFLREIGIAAQLVHPHIVPLYDSGRVGDLVYYVMPYYEGETLRDRLDREGVLPVEQALTVMAELGSALDHAHAHGVVHRDVKPSNVILTGDAAMLADFGVAIALEKVADDRLTQTGFSVGTPEYMSPEQATGSGSVGARSDVYALGCIAFEMLAGEAPFTGPSVRAVVARHLGAPPPDVRLLRPSLPPGVREALQRSLAKEPADRFETAGELASAVKESVETGGAEAGAAGARSRIPRGPLLVAALAVVGLLAVAVLVSSDGSAPTARASIPVPSQLTFEGDVRQAYGSPDGELLAYEVIRDGVFHLFVAEADGSSPVELYRSEGFACCPAWAPDGTRILVRAGGRSDGVGLLIPRFGGEPRRLPTDVVTAWSPDGERVVGWWPAADTLRFVDVATGEPDGALPLDVPHDWVLGVDWSPDGRRLAVVTTETTSASEAVLWTMPVDGGPPREAYRDSASLSSPHWDTAGSAIYFLRGGQDVWKLGVDDEGLAAGEPVRLVAGLSPNVFNATMSAFTVSADGERLHYARWDGQANLAEVDLTAGRADASAAPRWLTSGTAERREPRISPDGGRIAFLREGTDGWNLWVRDEDGATRQITYFDEDVSSPAWSADGRRLAFGGARGGDRGVWSVSADGGSASYLGGERYGGFEVIWLPTNQIVYQQSGDRTYGVLDVGTDAVSTIEAPDGVWLYGPRGSPDGRRVAFRGTGSETGLWIVDLEALDWVRVTDRALGPVAWSAAGDTVYAMPVASRSDASSELFAVPVDGGQARRIAQLPEDLGVNPWNASVAPAEGRFIGAVFRSTVDAWVLEGFDPSG